MDKAIGIINANYDTPDLKELINGRTAASVPFGGRFRMIDFALSNMVNAGITSVGIITPYKYRSLLDHVGAGSEWNLDRKNGGLFVLPGSVFGISSPGSRFLLRDFRRNMVFLSRAQAQYVVITTANVIANMDYSALIEQHEKSGADVTMATITATEADKDLMGVELEGGKVKSTFRGVKPGDEAFIDCFVVTYSLLLKVLEWYSAIDYLDFFEVLAGDYDKMDVRTYKVTGYVHSVYTAENYFKRNMDLLDPCVVDELFRDERPVLTKITDTAPTRYAETASAKNSLIPAGCMIDGTVENSVLFRGVKVKKGAIVRNSIIMKSCTIGENAVIENVIIDRSNVIAPGTVMKGAPDSVVIMAKNELGK